MQLPLLPAVLIAVSIVHAAAGAAISERELYRTPGIRFTKVTRQADPDAKAPHSAKGIKAGNFDDGVYVGDITLGTKSFRVQLDTGSSDLWVDHDGQSINQLGGESIAGSPEVQMSYALGTIVGTPVYGDVTLGEYHSKKQVMLSVTKALNIDGLKKYGINGMLGLGLDAGALIPTVLHEPTASVHSFLGNIFAQSPDAGSFTTWYLGRGGDGLMTINEIPEPFNTSIQSVPELDVWKDPIPGTLPRWTIELSGVEVAGKAITLPKSTQIDVTEGRAIAVVDTGATLTYVPKSISDAIYSSVPGAKFPSSVGAWLIPCTSEVSVAFTIDGTRYAIDPLDAISRPTELTLDGKKVSICIGAFVPAPAGLQTQLDLDILLGDNFLRNVFTVLHYTKPSVQLLSITDENEAKEKFAAARNETLKDYAQEADLSDTEVYKKVVSGLTGLPTTAPTPSGGDGTGGAQSTHQSALLSPILFVASCLVLLYI